MGPNKTEPLMKGGISKRDIVKYNRIQRWARTVANKDARAGQKRRKTPAPPTAPKYVEKKVGGDKNGDTRMVPAKKMRKSYEVELPWKKKKTICFRDHKRRLRPSITPGTVLILLAGMHRGKRVVFLKQLATGLLLITGPYTYNGCPLRRIDQRYVIATQTKIDISSLEVPERINDDYFKRVKARRPKPAEGDIFESKKEKFVPSDERREDQILVDKQLIGIMKQRDDKYVLAEYLKGLFSLKNKQYPHNMVF